MAASPSQNPMPKASLGTRADAVDGDATVYPGPKAAEVTDVAGWGAVVFCGLVATPPKVPRFMPGMA